MECGCTHGVIVAIKCIFSPRLLIVPAGVAAALKKIAPLSSAQSQGR